MPDSMRGFGSTSLCASTRHPAPARGTARTPKSNLHFYKAHHSIEGAQARLAAVSLSTSSGDRRPGKPPILLLMAPRPTAPVHSRFNPCPSANSRSPVAPRHEKSNIATRALRLQCVSQDTADCKKADITTTFWNGGRLLRYAVSTPRSSMLSTTEISTSRRRER